MDANLAFFAIRAQSILKLMMDVLLPTNFTSKVGTQRPNIIGRDPWSSECGPCSEGRGFESQHRILDGYFFTLISCKNCNEICLKRPKINEKEAGVGLKRPNIKGGRQWPMPIAYMLRFH